MIDASSGFMKDGPKNRLRSRDVHRIVDVFTRQQDVPKYARMVPFVEIEKNDGNLNLPRYIDSQPAEDRQDIEGHLKGGIPVTDVDALQRYWDVCPDLRKALFRPNRPGYVDLAVDKAAIKSSIYEHAQFAAFIHGMTTHFEHWRARAATKLKALDVGCHPKDVIGELSENLLAHYTGQPLIDRYDVYQHLMDYWAQTMQDDLYLIGVDGWKASTYRVIEQKKNKDGKVTKELDKGWACDLLPKSLIVARYFSTEQAALDLLAAEAEVTEAQLTELEEEHSGEDAAFSGFDKINKAGVKERLDEVGDDREAKGEIAVLKRWQKLDREKSELKKQIKDAEAALDDVAYAKYPQLSEAQIKNLAVDDKWLGTLEAAICGEMDRISQGLTRRVRELAERYETDMPQLANRVAELQARVDGHLERMGFAWK
jgi:type I restriction enzyme M protein